MTVWLSGNRSFGLVWAGVLALSGAAPRLHGKPFRPWALELSAVLLFLALALPLALQPCNAAWTVLGRALHRVMSPVAAAALFYGIFTPAGWIARLARRDPLRLKYSPGAGTYWIERGQTTNMRHPF